MGWFGLRSDVCHVLQSENADRDESGCYHVRGDCIVGFFPDEIVIGNNAEYLCDGVWKNLSQRMTDSPYGIHVHVIGEK